jgi:hypothetical protein
MVRSAKTKMIVRIGKFIEIQRGEADPPAVDEKSAAQLRSVPKTDPQVAGSAGPTGVGESKGRALRAGDSLGDDLL